MRKGDGARFFGKNPISPFLGKKGPKWSKDRVFANLTKIQSINVHFLDLRPSVGGATMNLLPSVRPSVCLSVASFSQDWIIGFF